MAAGPVNRTLLESHYQNPGDIYDDAKTEACFDVVADQIDDNWGVLANVTGPNGSQFVGSPLTVGVAGTNVHAQIVDLVAQIQAILNASIPDGTVNYSKLASDVIAAFVNTSGDTMTGPLNFNDANVSVKGAGGDFFINSAGGYVFLSSNAQFIGGVWNRLNTSLGAVRADIRYDGGITVLRANAGANPIVWDAGSQVYDQTFTPHVSGTYTGNGAATRDIALPFTPSAVYMPGETGNFGGFVVTGDPSITANGTILAIGTNKFTVGYTGDTLQYAQSNTNGRKYKYIAFR